jgi:hypothetical protein
MLETKHGESAVVSGGKFLLKAPQILRKPQGTFWMNFLETCTR